MVKNWVSILCGPWIPSSMSITNVCNIIIISFNICDIIVSYTKGDTPYQKKVGLLAKQHGLGMPWVSSWAAGGRDSGGFASVGTHHGEGYAT